VSAGRPRYVLRSTTGYPPSGGSGKATTFYVADTWTCYREAGIFAGVSSHYRERDALRDAVALCARLNREHEAWLAS
jgi:hypothetical protein